MNRPSHWILGFLAVLGGTLWWTGALADYLSARPTEHPRRGPGAAVHGEGAPRDSGPVVVRRDSSPPRPTIAEVSGRVVDRLGFPVVQARVRVAGEPGEAVTTDARGRFRLTVSGVVHKRLRIEAPGRHDAIEVAGSLDAIDVVLQDALPWTAGAASAPGQVANAGPATQATGLLFGEGWVKGADGRGVPNARVMVRETGATAPTDENGRYVIPLHDGDYTLVAFDGRGGVATSEPEASSRRQGKIPLPDLQLAKGPTLRGRVLNSDGEPQIDASVIVETGGVRRVTRTEQGGLFSVAGLVAGDCELIVLPHRGHLGLRRRYGIETDANLNDIVVRRPRQEPLRVQVVDGSGAPQPFVHVVASQLAGLCRAYAQADATGQVALRGLGDGELIDFAVRDRRLEPMTVGPFDDQLRQLTVAP